MGRTGNSGQSIANPVTLVVVEHVADQENIDPLDLPPLNDAIDPDALNTLFDNTDATVNRVIFSYYGYQIVVEGVEQVQVTPLEDGAAEAQNSIRRAKESDE